MSTTVDKFRNGQLMSSNRQTVGKLLATEKTM
ncbi:hypothetical protein WG66_000813, partial [Moniliophthora roreri]